MNILFWICWGGEMLVVLWWILTDMRQTSLPPNPNSYLALLYLTVVLILRISVHANSITNGMVMIPAIPLVGLVLIVVIAKLTGARWN